MDSEAELTLKDEKSEHEPPSQDDESPRTAETDPLWPELSSPPERRSVSPCLSLSPYSRWETIIERSVNIDNSTETDDVISDERSNRPNESSVALEIHVNNFDNTKETPTLSPIGINTNFDGISDERSTRSQTSVEASDIQVESTGTIKAKPMWRPPSPWPRDHNAQLRRERSNSREHDFDDMLDITIKIEPRSRSNSMDSEISEASICSTVINSDQDNGRGSDYDDESGEASLPTEQETRNGCQNEQRQPQKSRENVEPNNNNTDDDVEIPGTSTTNECNPKINTKKREPDDDLNPPKKPKLIHV